jgi:predicted transcriptional regulator
MYKDKVLSNDFKVCIKIYGYSRENSEKIWFSKLAEAMSGELSPSTISKCVDRLFDMGMIDGKWEKVDRHWIRTFHIAGEAEAFVKSLYDVTSD